MDKVAERKSCVHKTAKIVSRLVAATHGMVFAAWLAQVRWQRGAARATTILGCVFEHDSCSQAFEVWLQQTSYARIIRHFATCLLRDMLHLFFSAIQKQRHCSRVLAVGRLRIESNCQRSVMRLWRGRAALGKQVGSQSKVPRERVLMRIVHVWLRRALYGALAHKARQLIEGMHQTKVTAFQTCHAHFVRRFRASFYLWKLLTAVMYEARAQRCKALRRMRYRICRRALCCWTQCVDLTHSLQERSIRALHAASAIKRTARMILPVPAPGFLGRKT